MKRKLKGFYLLISTLCIGLITMPFAFAKSAAGKKLTPTTGAVNKATMKSVYDSLRLDIAGLSKKAFDQARIGFEKLKSQGKIINPSIISIVDFSQPSTEKRLYVIDLDNYRVLFNTYVAHGRNSGKEMAQSFSNQGSSYKSSPGFYVTRETYRGGHGYSLRLDGLEKGINDKAYERAIVIHGAEYVNPNLIPLQGYIGRSLGCPAVPTKLATPIINTIKNGTGLFIYHPSYSDHSSILG